MIIECLFGANHVMSSLPTPNAETSIRSRLTPYFHAWELSVSWGERSTLMKGFISTLSSILEDDPTSVTNGLPMLRAAIRMSNLLDGHQRRVGIMQSKTEMLSPVVLEDLMEIRFLRLAISGLVSAWQRVLTSFGEWFESWLHELFLPTSHHSGRTPIGTFDPLELHTARLPVYHSTYQAFRSSINGYITICLETE